MSYSVVDVARGGPPRCKVYVAYVCIYIYIYIYIVYRV